MQYFNNLEELIEFYKKDNMGLIRSLKYPVQREEDEATDDPDEYVGKESKAWIHGCLALNPNFI